MGDEKSFDVLHMVIKRESVKIALMRQEDAARTEEDFENLITTWNRLDDNRERRERRYEIIRTEDMLEWECSNEETIIPAPFEHVWWREMLKGSFLDFIHDCPYDIQEFTSSKSVYKFVRALKENQKEVLYYWAIRYWSPQKIAAMRGQTDRNILKTYATLIENLRRKLFMRWIHRFVKNKPLTSAQRDFVQRYLPVYCDDALRIEYEKAYAEQATVNGERNNNAKSITILTEAASDINNEDGNGGEDV